MGNFSLIFHGKKCFYSHDNFKFNFPWQQLLYFCHRKNTFIHMANFSLICHGKIYSIENNIYKIALEIVLTTSETRQNILCSISMANGNILCVSMARY